MGSSSSRRLAATLLALGQSIGGGYKPMPFNVNMGQGLSAVNTNAAHGSVGTTPNTMFPPRPVDMNGGMFPPAPPGVAQGPGFAPQTRPILQPGLDDSGMHATGKPMSKAQQLAHALKGMGG
jgi:hypothetical protein